MIGQEELFSPSVLPDTDTGDTRDQLENILSEESKVSERNPSFEESPSFEHHERLTPSSAQFRKDLKTTLSDDAEALEAQKQALAEKIVNTYLWNKPSHTRQVLRYLVILSEVCEHPEWASLNMDFLSDIYYHKMQPNWFIPDKLLYSTFFNMMKSEAVTLLETGVIPPTQERKDFCAKLKSSK